MPDVPISEGIRTPKFLQSCLWNTFPLWGCTLLLLLTRIEELGLRDELKRDDPSISISLGTLGEFHISPVLVLKLTDVFGESASWGFETLYVPFLLPFALVCVIIFSLNDKAHVYLYGGNSTSDGFGYVAIAESESPQVSPSVTFPSNTSTHTQPRSRTHSVNIEDSSGFDADPIPNIDRPLSIGLRSPEVPKQEVAKWRQALTIANERGKSVVAPIASAMLLSGLLSRGDAEFPTDVLGDTLADATGKAWILLTPTIGALGAFFSGSCTLSSLTFATLHERVANDLDLDVKSLLAMQVAGGALGNMIAISNIVTADSCVGTGLPIGSFLLRTAPPALLYACLCAALGWLFFFI